MSNKASGSTHEPIPSNQQQSAGFLQRLPFLPSADGTSAQLGTVLTGHGLRQLLGLVSSAMLARGLGPIGLSVFSVVGVVVSIGGTLFDFGLSDSVTRLVAERRAAEDRATAREYIQLYAYLKLAGAACGLGLVVGLAEPLSAALNLPADTGPTYLRLGALILLGSALSQAMGELLRALERFRRMVILQLALVLSLILLLAGPYLSQQLDTRLALLLNAVSVLFSAGIGFLLVPSRWQPRLLSLGHLALDRMWKLLSFSAWVWIAGTLSILLIRLDLLLLNSFLDPRTVGLYALAANLTLKLSLLSHSLHTVLLPKASGLSEPKQYRTYLRSNLIRSAVMAGAILLALPLAPAFIELVYGEEYLPAVPFLLGLIAVALLELFATPLLLLAFPLDLPQIMAGAELIGVITLTALGVLLIPAFGAYGVIGARLVAVVFRTVLLGAVIGRNLMQREIIT